MKNGKQSKDGSMNSQNISKLMSSIEEKLSMLAKDDFQVFPDRSSIEEDSTPHKNSRMQVQDLAGSRSEVASSPILSRFQHIEEHYLSKLTFLNQRVTILQTQNNDLLEKNRLIGSELIEHKERVLILQQEQERMLQVRIEEMKDNFLTRMRSEMEEQTENYLVELDHMREQLVEERKSRKNMQGRIQLISIEKEHFEEMYRDILGKYKMNMQVDLSYTQALSASHHKVTPRIDHHRTEKQEEEEERNNLSATKVKKAKKSKKIKEDPSSMPKEQLIPFLAKGISDLKEKLNLK